MQHSPCVLACIIASSVVPGAAAGAADAAPAAMYTWEYEASTRLEPSAVPGSPFLSSGLGSASLTPGETVQLRTLDVDPAGDGRFYYMRPAATLIESAHRIRIEVTVCVLRSEGQPCATSLQVPFDIGVLPAHPNDWELGPLNHGPHGEGHQEIVTSGQRRVALGFIARPEAPDDDEVLLLDSGGPGGPKVLGRHRLTVGIPRDYVLEIVRNQADPGQGMITLTLPGTDCAPLRAPLSALAPSPGGGSFGVIFGHPVGNGTGAAEWQRVRIEGEGMAMPAPGAPVSVETVPRTISRSRQLFLDDWLIDTMIGVQRRQGEPEKHPANPTFPRREPWEAARCELYGSAVWNPVANRLQLFYSAMSVPYDVKMAYAESLDRGTTWTRPLLDDYRFDGARTNIVWPGRYMVAGPSVFRDQHDPDPSRRYKLFVSDYPLVPGSATPERGDLGIDVAYSADGIQWTASPRNPVIPGYASDTGQSVFWDERTGTYVAYVRVRTGGFRSVARTESTDFETWSEPRVVLTPSAADRRRAWHYYSLSVTPYEGIYVGLVWIFPQTAASADGDADTPVTWPELMTSRDGIAWERVAFGKPFLPLGPPGSFDHRQIRTASSLVVLDDRILLVYSGSPHAHVASHAYDIGLATLRLDGFAALEALEDQGMVLTHPLLLPDGELCINAATAAGGSVRAEIVDASGVPLPGYSVDACLPVESDTTDALLGWRDHSLLPACPASGLRVRFVLRNARLYSFRVRRLP